jgi:primosomal protein N'
MVPANSKQIKQKNNLQKISNEDSTFFIKTFEEYSKFFDVDAISYFFSAITDLYLSANISSRDAIFNVKDKKILQNNDAFKLKLTLMTNTMLSFLDKKELEEFSNYKFIFESYFDNYRNLQMEKKRITARSQQQKSTTKQQKSTTKQQKSTTPKQKSTTPKQKLIQALHEYMASQSQSNKVPAKISKQYIQNLLNQELIDSITKSIEQG